MDGHGGHFAADWVKDHLLEVKKIFGDQAWILDLYAGAREEDQTTEAAHIHR